MTDTREMQRRHVKRIADELEAVQEGRAYYMDDDPYQLLYLDDADEDMPEEAEQAWFSDYFDETYNEHFIIDSTGELVGVRIMVACGGPNVWVDTYQQEVVSYWGCDVERYPLHPSTSADIEELYRELMPEVSR